MSRSLTSRGESSPCNLAGNSFQLQMRSTYDDNEPFPQPLFANKQQLWEGQHTTDETRLASSPICSEWEWLQEETPFTTTVQSNTAMDETESLIDDLLDIYNFTSFSGIGPVYSHDPQWPLPSNDLDEWLDSIDQFDQLQSIGYLTVADSSNNRQADSTEHDHFPSSMDQSNVLADNVGSNLKLYDRLMEYKITYHPSSMDCFDLVSPRSKPISLFE